MRRAVVAGQFYPEDKNELKEQINRLLGSLDVSSIPSGNVKAGIVPHAGYSYSGKCAACFYSAMKNREFGTALILGTNHSGMGENVCFSIEDFETPLGRVSSNIEIIEDLLIELKKTKIKVGVDEGAHRYEHSIEVQLPFLQYLGKKFEIVPVLVRDLSIKELETVANIFSRVIKNYEKIHGNVLIIASSDFTHYGKAYGFLPFTDKIRDNMYSLDKRAVDSVLGLDAEGFYSEARKSTICGGQVVTLLIQVAKSFKLEPKKLCYYTSGDVSGKWDNVVGYASFAFS